MSELPTTTENRVAVVEERRISKQGRVFVNRNLRLPSLGAIGFDLDHTLAHYAPIPVETLAFDVTKRKLVENKGYPAAILDYHYDPRFVTRGLVIDKKRGNIIKMNYHGYVSRAYHGRKELHTEDRKKQYRQRPIHLSNTGGYASVDTLFHLPEVYLYLLLVEMNQAAPRKDRRSFSQIYTDVREMIDEAHRDGTIKTVIVADPGKYLAPDPRMGPTLEHFRSAGKKLFLLTNSEYAYTDVLLSFLLKHNLAGKQSWRDFFDIIIVDARKPDFFTHKENDEPRPHHEELPGPPIWSGGGARFLEDRLGYQGDRILYFGDHTYGDILRSKKSVGWRTAMVIEEMEREIEALEMIRPKMIRLGTLAALRERLDADMAFVRRERNKLALIAENLGGSNPAVVAKVQGRLTRREDELARMQSELSSAIKESRQLRKENNEAFNSFWGSIFREGNETSRFGHQVEDFACLYTARVSNFLNYPASQYFQAPIRLMPHEI
ncbi:MAG TPA: HAD-IG family 5'-nucleotidase [Candidatus Eisenbacteria bacterium]